MEQFFGDTLDCHDGDYLPHSVCKSVLILWTPGSGWEMMREGTGMEAEGRHERRHFILLSVVYNPGTGFLADDSGVELFYTHKNRESQQ